MAIKVFDKARMEQKDVVAAREEARLLKKLDHPHIVKYIDIFESWSTVDDDNYIYIVMERMDTTLNSIIKRRGKL